MAAGGGRVNLAGRLTRSEIDGCEGCGGSGDECATGSAGGGKFATRFRRVGRGGRGAPGHGDCSAAMLDALGAMRCGSRGGDRGGGMRAAYSKTDDVDLTWDSRRRRGSSTTTCTRRTCAARDDGVRAVERPRREFAELVDRFVGCGGVRGIDDGGCVERL
jgi:hypothetical protein